MKDKKELEVISEALSYIRKNYISENVWRIEETGIRERLYPQQDFDPEDRIGFVPPCGGAVDLPVRHLSGTVPQNLARI